jgi:hypothetical protein
MTGEGFIFWLPEEEPAVHAEEILALLMLQRVQLNKSDTETKYTILSDYYYLSYTTGVPAAVQK